MTIEPAVQARPAEDAASANQFGAYPFLVAAVLLAEGIPPSQSKEPESFNQIRRIFSEVMTSALAAAPRGTAAIGQPTMRFRMNSNGIEPTHTAVVIPDHPRSAAVPSSPVNRVTTQK